jgi:subtilisin family serine protease
MNGKKTVIAFGVTLMLTGHVGVADAANRYLVVFKSEVLPADAADHINRAGGSARRALRAIGAMVASGDETFAQLIANDPDVLAVGVEQFHRLPPSLSIPAADDEFGMLDGAPTPADNLNYYQWDMRRIGAPAVWSRLPLATEGRRAVVAVLDSGVAEDHPDLAGQVIAMKSTSYCNTPGGPSNTASYPKYASYVDLITFPEWTPADGCTSLGGLFTHDFHGTHVAGTIAAKLGGGRVVGVAPEAGIAAYKVFDVILQNDPDLGPVHILGAFDGPIFAAIIDAAAAGYPVISMSLGGYVDRSDRDGRASWHAWNRVAKLADKLGAVIIASAGNGALNLNGPIAHIPSDLPTVISTSATAWSELQQAGNSTSPWEPAPGSHDLLAAYSNFGAPVDVSAPGGDCGPVAAPACLVQYLVLSSYIAPSGALGYAFAAGTSMAAPHVSAVAAMVRALHPGWKPAKVRSYLQQTAEHIGRQRHFGRGMIDADAAVH